LLYGSVRGPSDAEYAAEELQPIGLTEMLILAKAKLAIKKPHTTSVLFPLMAVLVHLNNVRD
jgi:hypothetical protein